MKILDVLPLPTELFEGRKMRRRKKLPFNVRSSPRHLGFRSFYGAYSYGPGWGIGWGMNNVPTGDGGGDGDGGGGE